eukprot:Clim_evm19s216 gene=Clim_evmTU19s216
MGVAAQLNVPVVTEFHYDNIGTDVNEFVEVFVPSNLAPRDFYVVFYNGSNNKQYHSEKVADFDKADCVYNKVLPRNGVQNGPRDGICLVQTIDGIDQVLQFISYEGVLTADDGPCAGITSIDIAVSEDGDTAVDGSLYLRDCKTNTWAVHIGGLDPNTRGSIPEIDVTCSGNSSPEVPEKPQTIVPIHDIQGATFFSPLHGQSVTTAGVITHISCSARYANCDVHLQAPDSSADNDDATSEAIVIYRGDIELLQEFSAGEAVYVTGTVVEAFEYGQSFTRIETLTATGKYSGFTDTTVSPILIGLQGRPVPQFVIDPSSPKQKVDYADPVQAISWPFNPQLNAIDFYESLEYMVVEVSSPKLVADCNHYNEVFTVTDHGSAADPPVEVAGHILLHTDADGYGDWNAEKVRILVGSCTDDADIFFSRGAVLENVVGFVEFSFGLYGVKPLQAVIIASQSNEPAADTDNRVTSKIDCSSSAVGAAVSIATYNMLNLSPVEDDDAQMHKLASQIAGPMDSPAILGLQEVQDNDGDYKNTPSGQTDVVSADQTLSKLRDLIAEAGGAMYNFVDIYPDSYGGDTGGIPGGHIRNVFMWREDCVDFVEAFPLSPELFEGTRRPVLGHFRKAGVEFDVLNVHFPSRSGSGGLFENVQPFPQGGAADGKVQAQFIHDFVQKNHRETVVHGDFNTFETVADLTEILPGTGANQVLFPLFSTEPNPQDVYTYEFQGNSQVLDHFFVTKKMQEAGSYVDYMHLNVHYLEDSVVASDHDPIVAFIAIPQPE